MADIVALVEVSTYIKWAMWNNAYYKLSYTLMDWPNPLSQCPLERANYQQWRRMGTPPLFTEMVSIAFHTDYENYAKKNLSLSNDEWNTIPDVVCKNGFLYYILHDFFV